MTAKKRRAGPLSNPEKAYIQANAGRMTPAAIAAHLNRTPEIVLRELALAPAQPVEGEPVERSEIRLALKQSAAWKQLIEELYGEAEVAYAEEQFVELFEQFKDDVLATEKNQIIKVIRLAVLMHRNAVKQKAVTRTTEKLDREYDRLTAHEPDEWADADRVRAMKIETDLNRLADQQGDLASEYVKLEDKHQKLMEALKATRQQRIDRIDTDKKSFLDIVKDLQAEDVREREGRLAAQMKRATEKELTRLGSPHRYDDGAIDQPILSCDTIEMLDSGAVVMPEVDKGRAAKKREEVHAG